MVRRLIREESDLYYQESMNIEKGNGETNGSIFVLIVIVVYGFLFRI